MLTLVPLNEFLKLFKCQASNSICTIAGWLDILSKVLHEERKRRNERILTWLVTKRIHAVVENTPLCAKINTKLTNFKI